MSAQDSQHETDLDSSKILLINVMHFSVGLFLLRYNKTFKIVEIFSFLDMDTVLFQSCFLPFFFSPSVYFCCATMTSLYFPVVMCELLYLYVRSKRSITKS